MTEELLGRIVVSKAGRDKGRRFAVVAIEDDAHLRVADGDTRKLARAKKKKLKHLRFESACIQGIAEMISDAANAGDAMLRKALRAAEAPIENHDRNGKV